MEWPTEVPLMTLPNAILFPDAMMPLYIFEPRYRRMLEDALQTNRMFSVAMRRPDSASETPCRTGGLGLIRASVRGDDGTSHVILQGLARVELLETVKYKPYRVQRIRPLETIHPQGEDIRKLTRRLLELVAARLDQASLFPEEILEKLEKKLEELPSLNSASVRQVVKQLVKLDDSERLADMISCTLLSRPAERQAILETPRLEQRLKILIQFLKDEIKRNADSGKN